MTERKSKKFWDEHVAAAQRSGKPLSQYAAQHGLNREVLYAARNRRALMGDAKLGAVAMKSASTNAISKPKTASAFVPVKIASARATQATMSSRLTARLPNGVVIECEASLWSEAQTRVLMLALASV